MKGKRFIGKEEERACVNVWQKSDEESYKGPDIVVSHGHPHPELSRKGLSHVIKFLTSSGKLTTIV